MSIVIWSRPGWYGSAHWYAEQPSIENAWWSEPTNSKFGHDETVNLPLGCDWRLTLRKRLEVTTWQQ